MGSPFVVVVVGLQSLAYRIPDDLRPRILEFAVRLRANFENPIPGGRPSGRQVIGALVSDGEGLAWGWQVHGDPWTLAELFVHLFDAQPDRACVAFPPF